MILLLLSLLGLSLQFNLDTQSVQVLKNDNGLFGYTVALQKKGAGDTEEKLIMVGSPNAETGVEGVSHGGAVFKCKIPRLDEMSDEPVECDDFVNEFNDGGNSMHVFPNALDVVAENKSDQFLGVSMAANDKWVVVCGHRYEHRFWVESYIEDLPRQLIGRCLVEDVEMGLVEVFKPCDNYEDSGYMTYGFCQAGMSVALRDDTLIIGAPGTHQAVGSAYHYNLAAPFVKEKEMDKIPTPQNVPTTDKYIGYSSVICNMDGDIEWNGYELVFGGPRGEMYSGEVRIYSSISEEIELSSLQPLLNDDNASIRYNFKGEQMGAYFGHSLACADVDGDGYEDVIVGAPWYTDYTDIEINADTGRIYIMYGSEYLEDIEKLENPQKITGGTANGAFGYSLANGGDMNNDNFMDVFVGSPYYNDGEGAVFLYLGSADGLQSEYSQIITPSNLNVKPTPGIKTFGWSISPGMDVDGNGYPDVAIGAYKSGHVTFIRSKSIIDVIPVVDFLKSSVFNDTHKVTTVQVCLSYNERTDRDPLDIEILPINVTATVDPVHKRLSFSKEEARVIKWIPEIFYINTTDNSPLCTTKEIHYDNSTGNVQPMPLTLKAEIDNEKLTSLVLNQELIRAAAKELEIQSECHPDTGVCLADLTVEFAEGEVYDESNKYPSIVFGYVQSFTQKIKVTNIGTDQYNYVYNAAVKVKFPAEISYSGVSIDSGNVVCDMEDGFLLCKISDDGPINGDSNTQTFGIEFDISNITAATNLRFKAEVMVEDPTEDEDSSNNKASKVVVVRELADLLINGGAGRSKVAFNNKYTIVNRAIGSPDLDIKHEYSVELSEDADRAFIRGVGIDIYWPQKVPVSGLYIVPLYNISMRSPEGVKVICRPSLEELYPEAVGSGDYVTVSEEVEIPKTDITQAVLERPSSLNCADDKDSCQLISCEIDEIKRGSAFTNGFKIALYGKVHEANLYDSPGMNVSSLAEITKVANETKMMELPVRRSVSARTELYPSVRKSQNWIWVIIGGIIGGLLLLFLLILALWKCGFFKRKQPPTIKADKYDEQIDMTVYGQ